MLPTDFLDLGAFVGEATLGILVAFAFFAFTGDILGLGAFTVLAAAGSLVTVLEAPRFGLLEEDSSSSSFTALLFFSAALLTIFLLTSFEAFADFADVFSAALETVAFFGLTDLAFLTPRVLASVDDGALASTACQETTNFRYL